MKNIGLWFASLAEKVFLGKSKDLWNWHRKFTWDKKDITNEFLHICEQFFKKWESRVIKKEKQEEESLYIHIANTKKAKEWLIKSLKFELERWEVCDFCQKTWDEQFDLPEEDQICSCDLLNMSEEDFK